MLRSFRDKDTARVWRERRSRRLNSKTTSAAYRTLMVLHAARALGDLRSPPGNRLEKLKGNRAGQYSIRINQQYRVCFTWSDAGPEDIEITDYH